MKIHGTIDAWDDTQFNLLVDKFEDDEAEDEDGNKLAALKED